MTSNKQQQQAFTSQPYEADDDKGLLKKKLSEEVSEEDSISKQGSDADPIKLSSRVGTNMAALRTWIQDWCRSGYNFRLAESLRQNFFRPFMENNNMAIKKDGLS